MGDLIRQECEEFFQEQYGMSVEEYIAHPNPVLLSEIGKPDPFSDLKVGTTIHFAVNLPTITYKPLGECLTCNCTNCPMEKK